MQFKSLLVAAGLAAAAPTPTGSSNAVVTPDAFSLIAIRSGSEVHYSPFQAALSSIFLQLPSTNASCDATTDSDAATFYISSGQLFLYKTDNPPQQIWVDRSGMGQGNIGYITGAQSPPRNGELKGWGIDAENGLTLDGAGFLACPGATQESWGIWVSAGVEKPAGLEGCVGVKARVEAVAKPVSCYYTESQN